MTHSNKHGFLIREQLFALIRWFDGVASHRWRGGGLYLFCGAIAATGLPPIFNLPASLLAFGILERLVRKAASWRAIAWRGFCFGVGYHTVALYWLTNAILTRAHDYWWVVPFAAPGCALVLAPFIAMPLVIARNVPDGWRRLLTLAGAWTVFDMSRVYLFSGFPWNPPGTTLAFPGRAGDCIIQLTAYFGVDGLTYLFVLTGFMMWKSARARMCVVVVWSGLIVAGYLRISHPSYLPIQNPTLILVQGNESEDAILTQENAVTLFERYLRLTRRGVAQAIAQSAPGPIVYVWPESGFPGLIMEDSAARSLIASAAKGRWGIIGSDRRNVRGEWFNSAVALDGVGRVVDVYDKARLVPFGEYQPRFIPFNLLPEQLTPGPGPVTWASRGLGTVSPMVCFEVIFSGQIVAHHRPNYLLNITNDAWFGNSAGPRQHLVAARLRAVEEGLPLAQAANTGITAAFDGFGHELEHLRWGVTDVLSVQMPPPLAPTFFAINGRSTVLFVALLSLSSGLLRRKMFKTIFKDRGRANPSTTMRV